MFMEKNGAKKTSLSAEPPKKEEKLNPALSKIKDDFFEVSRYQRKRENLLLGEFSADGKYAIKDEKILASLVSMPKIFQEKVDNTFYAYAKYDGINLNFKIVADISESYCSAELFLVEVEHTLEKDNKLLTSLSNVVEIYSPKFRDNIFKAWNINLQETPLEKDDGGKFVFDYLRVVRGQYDFNKELIELLSQLYVVRLLKLLESCGDLGVKILADYKLLVEKLLRNDPSLTQDYTRLKQLLDQVIAKHKGFDTILQMGGGTILKNFSEPIDRVRGKVPSAVAVEKKESEEKVSAEKSPSASPKKKKGKSKGGDSPKPFIYSIKNYTPQVFSVPDPVVASILNPIPPQEQTIETPQARPSANGGLFERANNAESDEKNDKIVSREELDKALNEISDDFQLGGNEQEEDFEIDSPDFEVEKEKQEDSFPLGGDSEAENVDEFSFGGKDMQGDDGKFFNK